MKKIGIYGGTFSPPHRGHVSSAEIFSEYLSLDELIIMPDYLPPHKTIDGEAEAEERLEMSKFAFSHIKNVIVSDYEIKKGGKSYTADTLTHFYKDGEQLYFLVGTDMFLTLDEWYMPSVIFEKAVICYVRREDSKENDELLNLKEEEYKGKFSAKIVRIPNTVTEVSSSEVRALLKAGKNADCFLSESVYEYIKEKGLYT